MADPGVMQVDADCLLQEVGILTRENKIRVAPDRASNSCRLLLAERWQIAQGRVVILYAVRMESGVQKDPQKVFGGSPLLGQTLRVNL